MGVHGFVWVCMSVHGYAWAYIGVHGSVGISGCAWVCGCGWVGLWGAGVFADMCGTNSQNTYWRLDS